MPITAAVASSSLTPAQFTRARGPVPLLTVRSAPFTPAAQEQANAINTGRDPNRGAYIDIHVTGFSPSAMRKLSQAGPQVQSRVASVNIRRRLNLTRGLLVNRLA